MQSSPPDYAKNAPGLARQVTAAVGGAMLYALLFGLCGAMSRLATVGVVGGAAVGVFVGYGLLNGLFGPIVVWTSVFTVFLALLGPTCDADPMSSGLMGAVFGALFSFADWRWLAIPIGAVAGATIGGCVGGDEDGMLRGLGCGAFLGWLILVCLIFISEPVDKEE